MPAETVLPTEPATSARSALLTPHFPVRVFLVSDRRLLREALARALKSHADILLVGAEEFSAVTAESSGSAFDVLLVDPLSTSAFDAQTAGMSNTRFSNLRTVTIEMEAGISDLISSILLIAPSEDRYSG